MTIESKLLCNIIEGALLAAASPMSASRLAELFDEEDRPSIDEIKASLEDIRSACSGRGFELNEVASGWRFQVRQEMAPWVNRLWEEKPAKYSRASMETLALIAYRQPITRGDIEEIRGVAVSSSIIKSFLERGWVRIVGHRDVPGRPALYATTRQFLDYFNLKSLDALPSLAELKDFDSLNSELSFENGEAEEALEPANAVFDGESRVEGGDRNNTAAADQEAGKPAEGTVDSEQESSAHTVAESEEKAGETLAVEKQSETAKPAPRSLSDLLDSHLAGDDSENKPVH